MPLVRLVDFALMVAQCLCSIPLSTVEVRCGGCGCSGGCPLSEGVVVQLLSTVEVRC